MWLAAKISPNYFLANGIILPGKPLRFQSLDCIQRCRWCAFGVGGTWGRRGGRAAVGPSYVANRHHCPN
jgi:hypothetical protein